MILSEFEGRVLGGFSLGDLLLGSVCQEEWYAIWGIRTSSTSELRGLAKKKVQSDKRSTCRILVFVFIIDSATDLFEDPLWATFEP
jgi:hypothetical protein